MPDRQTYARDRMKAMRHTKIFSLSFPSSKKVTPLFFDRTNTDLLDTHRMRSNKVLYVSFTNINDDDIMMESTIIIITQIASTMVTCYAEEVVGSVVDFFSDSLTAASSSSSNFEWCPCVDDSMVSDEKDSWQNGFESGGTGQWWSHKKKFARKFEEWTNEETRNSGKPCQPCRKESVSVEEIVVFDTFGSWRWRRHTPNLCFSSSTSTRHHKQMSEDRRSAPIIQSKLHPQMVPSWSLDCDGRHGWWRKACGPLWNLSITWHAFLSSGDSSPYL